MENKRNNLPDTCYITLQDVNNLVVLKKNESPYSPCREVIGNYDAPPKKAEQYNNRSGLSPAQIEAMFCETMFSWDNAGGYSQSYLDSAILYETTYIEGHLCHQNGILSSPVKGNLYLYKIVGKDVFYLDLNAIVAYSDYYLRFGTGCLLPDLITGIPLLPVKAIKQKNGTYTLIIEETAVEPKETNAAYTICCRVDVGIVQFVLAYNTSQKATAQYATWERTPSIECENTLPTYYLGHYSSECHGGMTDFIQRITEKFEWQKKSSEII